MNEKIAKLNKVIVELNLVVAKLVNNDPTAELMTILNQAKLDPAAATRTAGGVGQGGGQDNAPNPYRRRACWNNGSAQSDAGSGSSRI